MKQVLIHGELDQYVPVDLSIAYYEKAFVQNNDVRLIILPEVDHFMVIDPISDAWKSIIKALKTLA